MPRIADPRIGAATAPLPPTAVPAAEARDGEHYAALEAAMRQMERDGPANVDWPQLVRDAVGYLATEAKDLTVATWLAAGLARTDGLRGIAIGLAILNDLVSTAWDTAYPPVARLRARQGALGWLADTLGPLVPDSGPVEAAASAAEDLAGLDAALRERMPPDGVGFTELRRRLRALCAAAVAPAAVAAPPAPSGTAPPPTDPTERLLAMREDARRAALGLLEARDDDPRAYALLRALTWIEITAPPPQADGVTQVEPPPEAREEELASLRAAGNPAALVMALERLCSDLAMFWLDGQREVHAALCDRGAAYACCAEAVRLGVRALLARLPSLPELAFSDGRPFADDATRAWIQSVVMADGSGPAAAPPPWQDGAVAARGLVAAGKREEALALLDSAARAAADGRSRFHWRIAEGRHCLDAGQSLVALSLAQELDECIARHGLEEWEPSAARDALRFHYDCIVTKNSAMIPSDADRTTARDALLARLARLDPVLVARLAGSFRKSH